MKIDLKPDELRLVKRALESAALRRTFSWLECNQLKSKIERQEKEPGIVDEFYDNYGDENA